MQSFIHYYIKIVFYLKTMFTKTSGLVLAVPTVTISTTIDPQKAMLLLLYLFALDFITGILASYILWKKTKSKERLISSEKLRLSGVKLFTYCSCILTVYAVEMIFFERKFVFEIISNKEFTITSVAIAFFCAIEFYSIVFENIKKCGFDVFAKFSQLISIFKKTQSKITS